MLDLTRQEALALARKKWGPTAFVAREGDRYMVGYPVAVPMGWRRVGNEGISWADACRAAGLVEEEQG